MEQGYRQLRGAGLTAEREELFRLTRRGTISDEVSRKLIRNLDLLETRQRD
jgi:CPA1 family monovalent cation:H+ antiporter